MVYADFLGNNSLQTDKNYIGKNGFGIDKGYISKNYLYAKIITDYIGKNDLMPPLFVDFISKNNLSEYIYADTLGKNSLDLSGDFLGKNSLQVDNSFIGKNSIVDNVISNKIGKNSLNVDQGYIGKNSFNLDSDYIGKNSISESVTSSKIGKNSLNLDRSFTGKNSLNLESDYIGKNSISDSVLSSKIGKNSLNLDGSFTGKDSLNLTSDYIGNNSITDTVTSTKIGKNSLNLYGNLLGNNSLSLNLDHIGKNSLTESVTSSKIGKNSLNLDGSFTVKNSINLISDYIGKNNMIDTILKNYVGENSLNIFKDYIAKNSLALSPSFIGKNNLSETIKKDYIGSLDIRDKDNVYKKYTGALDLLDEASLIIFNSFSASIDGNEVHFLDMGIGQDLDSYCISFSGSLRSIADWSLCIAKEEIEFVINSVTFNMMIDSRDRKRAFNSESFSVSGRSLTSKLDKGYAEPISTTYETDTTVYAIIYDLCNLYDISLNFLINDRPIPGGLYAAEELFPIQIIKELIEPAGAKMQTLPDGTLQIQYEYPVPPPEYANITPDIYLSDTGDFYSIDESKDIRAKYNAVLVMDIPERDSTDYQIEVKEETNTTVELAIYTYPFKDTLLLQTSHSLSGMTISYNGLVEETIDASIEVVDGISSVSYPVVSVISHSYGVSNNLGALTFLNKEIKTNTKGNSLLDITYLTKYHSYSLTNLNEDSVQYYIEEED